MFTTSKSKPHICISKLCFLGSDITHLKISPTFVLFGHVVRCFLQYLSLLSILCTSKYIYYLILQFCYQKRCENTMFLQSAIVKCIFLSRISNPICICMQQLLDYIPCGITKLNHNAWLINMIFLKKISLIHRESKKGATLTVAITLSILDGFAKFFHCCKEQ